MFSKRPDKHTTGLINMRNDCFANSSVQAYSALPGLTEYLNQFYLAFRQLKKFVDDRDLDVSHLLKSKTKTKFKNSNTFEIPLHTALAQIVKKLQDTQLTSRTISVWTFLHCLENIFNAKISRSQHDAQELTQLINETLEFENGKIKAYLAYLKKNLASMVGPNNVPAPRDYEILELIEVPDFPFSGLILSQMKCLACKGVSKPSFSPFLMLTLHAPEKLSTDIETLLNENESETIEGYHCLKCRISRIVQEEDRAGKNDSNPLLKRVRTLHEESTLAINEDLDKDLEEFIKNYKTPDCEIAKVTSTVLRTAQILKPPKIFGLHLSRSSFNGVDITRNPCRVSFKDQLILSIGKEYLEELQKFQSAAAAQDEAEIDALPNNVLTHDVNDMEDEDVQREDFDEKGSDDEDDEEALGSTDADSTVTETETATEGDDDAEYDSDNEDVISTARQSIMTTGTLKDNTATTNQTRFSDLSTLATKTPETLNNAPITEDQTDRLKEHFKAFKFNDNDVYKYRLKAVIRHQGSHTQGHYECYKRKPLFVKDKEGTIFKLSPEIIDEVNDEVVCNVQKATEKEAASIPGANDKFEQDAASNKFKKFSMTRSNSVRRTSSSSNEGDPLRSRSSSNAVPLSQISDDQSRFPPNEEIGGSGFRRRFSTMMGRRPSVIQGHPQESSIQEIVNSGSQTPAELLVGDLEPNDYFSNALANGALENIGKEDEHKQESTKKIKMKKISSLIKNPFWRISDSQVTEVSKESVLCETTSVYMLYYERVDRKQIKEH
ncbi:cysteine proteinase [Suhomyces tanzawaensis NRRL Y-17324]|uniref:Cysteine proteinase n=1 Tax=Suhomyces tanzawaensis NRRL Y-17324 TaxID=984487 RepID=A0A1E4SRY8_9ASCO|nr:cysteine proteinase [Suhomyces tanzawaensis NRRL Y-17324]ODV82271.1 cysteine proteinase [Suhomyces tanzawaensis NRRL Y-17324]